MAQDSVVDITDINVIKQLINKIEGIENDNRKRFEYDSYKIYSGQQKLYVERNIQTLFPDSHKSMRLSNINVLKKVVNKISRAYKKPPKRIVEGNENATESLNNIYDDNSFNRTFKSMDTGFNRHKYQLMWVQNDPELNTEFKIKSMNPYLFDVVIDNNTNEMKVVALSYPGTDITHFVSEADGINQAIANSQDDSAPNIKTYSFWNNTHNVNVRAKKVKIGSKPVITEVTFIRDDANPLMLNPLGVLPFVWLTNEPDVPEYPIRSSLPEESVNINILNSDLLTASALQGFGQLVVKYPKGSKIDLLHSGFTTFLELPQSENPDAPETTAEYINANPDLKGMRDVVYDYAASVMSDNGLDGVSLDGSDKTFTSGFDRMLAMADVTEVREDNIQFYEGVEKQIFEIIKKYDEVNGTRMFSSEDSLSIIFPKPEIMQSEKEKLEIIEKRIDLGLIEGFEKFMIDNPNLSLDDAMEKSERIDAEKLERQQSFMGPMNGGNNERDNEDESQS